jgi:hypothetical protein
MREGYVGVEEISDLANFSSIVIHNDQRAQQQLIRKQSLPENRQLE